MGDSSSIHAAGALHDKVDMVGKLQHWSYGNSVHVTCANDQLPSNCKTSKWSGPAPEAALLGALLRLQLPPERLGRMPSPAAPKPASPVMALASLPDALQVMPLAGDLTGESLPT